jgi:hypothetical protein
VRIAVQFDMSVRIVTGNCYLAAILMQSSESFLVELNSYLSLLCAVYICRTLWL